MSLKVFQDTPSLRERTTQVLREAILSLKFKPGQKLVERKLCDDTGVSRTCIREALRHLEAEGLVRRAHNKGIYVASISRAEAIQIYEVRLILETEMVRNFVARATEHDIAALQKAMRLVQRLINKDAIPYAAALDGFARALWDGAGNGIAAQLLSSLSARISYIRVLTSRNASVSDRETTVSLLSSILEAIEARDALTAAEQYQIYLKRSLSRMLDVVEGEERVAA